MSSQHVVLVAGFNYMAWPIEPAQKPDGTNFAGFCEQRFKWLLKALQEPTFWLFDVGAGVLKVNEKAANGRRQWQNRASFKRVTRADNYTGRDFTKNATGVMSIMDVYRHVQQIGRTEPGTLAELSFFSHSLYKGPILVNSYDKAEKQPKRAEGDKDGRYKKDFIPPNMMTDDLASFRKAFAPGGSIWVWGCDASTIYWDVFKRIASSSKYKSTAPGKLQDNDTFTFTYSELEAKKYYSQDDFFPAQTSKGTFLLKWDATFKRIKKFYEEGLADTYTAKIATAAKVLTYGALPGTWASVTPDPDGLMHVPKSKKQGNGDDFSGLIAFYGWYLGAPEDYEGRGYGTFRP